jgi:hypothetical protein
MEDPKTWQVLRNLEKNSEKKENEFESGGQSRIWQYLFSQLEVCEQFF